MKKSYSSVIALRSERRDAWRLQQTANEHLTAEDKTESSEKLSPPKKKAKTSHNSVFEDELQTTSPPLGDICFRRQTFPPLKVDVAPAEQEKLFIQHLRLCRNMINFQLCHSFMHSNFDWKDRIVKERALNQVINYIIAGRGVLTAPVYPEIVQTVASNMFRTLPPYRVNGSPAFDNNPCRRKEEESVLLTCWSRLRDIYKLLLSFLESADFQPSLGQEHVDHKFVIQLLELFDSRDPRERKWVKFVVYRIYKKLPGLQTFLRNHINYIFLRYIYETEHFNGVSELLEVVARIINEIKLPLKAEEKRTLAKVLLPLHTVTFLRFFRQELALCLVQYVKKDPSGTTVELIVKGLIKYWPITCASKQVLFLEQFQEVLSESQPHQWVNVLLPFLDLISACINSPHGKVTDRALDLWEENSLSNFFAAYSKPITDFIPF